MDTFASIQAFVRVVESGGFAGAARSLGISTAMVSKHITALEARLGVRLLDRNTRKTAPTEAGQRYFEHCVDMLSSLEHAESELTDRCRTLRGTLRVTAPIEFGNAHLVPLVPDFLREYPHLKVVLDLSNRVVDLVAEGMDVAIRISQQLDSVMAGRQLASSSLMVLAAPEYLKQHGWPDTIEQLADLHALCFSVPAPMTEWRYRLNGQTGSVRVTSRLETTSSEALRSAAVRGSGITLLPTFVAGDDIAAGRLIQLFPDADFGALQIHVLYAHRRHVPAKVRAFIDFLLRQFGDVSSRDSFLRVPLAARNDQPVPVDIVGA